MIIGLRVHRQLPNSTAPSYVFVLYIARNVSGRYIGRNCHFKIDRFKFDSTRLFDAILSTVRPENLM